MKLLSRYVFLNHARLVLLTLGLGLGLFLLTEIVERVDSFVEAGSSLGLVLRYYGARLPSIASQILPAVFLLASVISLCVMSRSREMIALQAGGISPNTVAWVLVFCGLFWGTIQLVFSQVLGSEGERYASRIWEEQVRQRKEASLTDVWFMDGAWIVSAQTLYRNGSGKGLTAYELAEDGLTFASIVNGVDFTANHKGWTVRNVRRFFPSNYTSEDLAELTLPLSQDVEVFFLGGQDKPQQMPLWMLGGAIRQLKAAGSNVEGLLTAWHGKLAYAASLVVMAVVAAAIVSWKDNVYLAVALSLLVTFVAYALNLFGESLGQRGLLPPLPAAWGPNALLLLVAFLRLRSASSRD